MRERLRKVANEARLRRVVFLRYVAHHEPIPNELALDGLDGADDTRIGRRKESHLWDEQERRIELGGAVVLYLGSREG